MQVPVVDKPSSDKTTTTTENATAENDDKISISAIHQEEGFALTLSEIKIQPEKEDEQSREEGGLKLMSLEETTCHLRGEEQQQHDEDSKRSTLLGVKRTWDEFETTQGIATKTKHLNVVGERGEYIMKASINDAHDKNDDGDDDFPNLLLMRGRKNKKRMKHSKMKVEKHKKKKGTLTINLSQSTIQKSKLIQNDVSNQRQTSQTNLQQFNDERISLNDDTSHVSSLDFYSDVHEDQDQETNEILKNLNEEKKKLELKKIEQKCIASKLILAEKLEKNWNNEYTKFLTQVKVLRQQLSEKQAKQRKSLAEQVAQSITSKESEAREAIKIILANNKRQMDLINIKLQQQQQHYPNTVETEKQKAAYLSQIQSTFIKNQSAINQKLEAFKVSKKSEYDLNRDKLDKHHNKRKLEMATFVRQNQNKLLDKQKLHRICHEDLEVKKQNRLIEEVMKRYEKYDISGDDYSYKERKTMNQESISNHDNQNTGEKDTNKVGAAIHRLERRRLVFQQSPISLVVEIHNEGLRIISIISSEDEERKLEHDFLPWGYKASQLLQSIMSGEFPLWKNDDTNFKINVLQGGHIKCTIADLRSQYENALFHPEVKDGTNTNDIKTLRDNVIVLKERMDSQTAILKLSKDALNENLKGLRQSEQKLKSLQYQTQLMTNPDGTSKLRMETKQKLGSAVSKFEVEISMHQKRNKELHQNYIAAQNRKSQIMEELKRALKEYQQADDGSQQPGDSQICNKYANDAISKSIISPRKEILDRRSDSLKDKGFKTTTIILRPTKTRQDFEFRHYMKSILKSDSKDNLIRAEELYLLSLHPPCESKLPTSPCSINQDWAEPGHQLFHCSIMPKHLKKPQSSKQTVFAQSHSDFSTIKGRQLSTLTSRLHITNSVIGNNTNDGS